MIDVFTILEDRAALNQNMSFHDLKALVNLRAADKQHNTAMKLRDNALLQAKLKQLNALGWSYDDAPVRTKPLRKRSTRSGTQSRNFEHSDFELLKYNNLSILLDIWLPLRGIPTFQQMYADTLTKVCGRYFLFRFNQRFSEVTKSQVMSHILYVEEVWYHASRHEIHMLVVDEDVDMTRDLSSQRYPQMTPAEFNALMLQTQARVENVALWVCIDLDRQANEVVPRVPRLKRVYLDDPRRQRERFIQDTALYKMF